MPDITTAHVEAQRLGAELDGELKGLRGLGLQDCQITIPITDQTTTAGVISAITRALRVIREGGGMPLDLQEFDRQTV